MRVISLFTVSILCLLQSFAISTSVRDTIPGNIKKYSKAQFLSEFGKDETSQKIIRYYFYRNKNARQSQYIFPVLAALSTGYGIAMSSGSSGGGGYGVLIGIGAFFFAISFSIISIQAFTNHRKYSPQKLYKQLMDYQSGKPLPKKLKRQIKYFTRQ
jgi:hypothetical protein